MAGTLPLSSVTTRSASFGPTPLARPIIALSCTANPLEISDGDITERMANATREPTPCTVVSRLNQLFSASLAKP
ncbi:hypothetical protein FQZ97_1229060 [compost metagenome]